MQPASQCSTSSSLQLLSHRKNGNRSTFLRSSRCCVCGTCSESYSSASADFLGFRWVSNDQSVRDLGYASEIGGIHILTFGDGVSCTDAETGENCNCALITARDGAGIPGDDLLSYTDIDVRDDLCDRTPQMAAFCPILTGEDGSSGLGLTNIIAVNNTPF